MTNKVAGEQQIKDQAVASGNFGGGREGAMLGQYQSDRLADRAALQASMLQQGFGQANQLAQQNFQNQGYLVCKETYLDNKDRWCSTTRISWCIRKSNEQQFGFLYLILVEQVWVKTFLH